MAPKLKALLSRVVQLTSDCTADISAQRPSSAKCKTRLPGSYASDIVTPPSSSSEGPLLAPLSSPFTPQASLIAVSNGFRIQIERRCYSGSCTTTFFAQWAVSRRVSLPFFGGPPAPVERGGKKLSCRVLELSAFRWSMKRHALRSEWPFIIIIIMKSQVCM